jgi:hypothetical protein
MTCRVLWAPHAEQRLEELIQSTDERELLAAAARQIDRALIADPLAFGESRYDTVRIGFVRPLGIQFEVMDDVRTVIVYDVWRIDRRAI